MPKLKLSHLVMYMNLCVLKNYMMWVLITSGAKGLLPTLGFGYGVGKSTLGLHLLNHNLYAGNWDKTKRNCIGSYWEMKPILDRLEPTNGVYFDDMQLTLGKDKQHDPEIRELAYYLTTVRPYVHVWIGSAPHRDYLQKDFRALIDFEIICSQRGVYEVQQLKRRINFKRPDKIDERFKYRSVGVFTSLPRKDAKYGDIQSWYDAWRHEQNREIRKKLRAFKGVEKHELDLNALTLHERKILDKIAENGFVRYETLHDKGLSLVASRLKRRGWLELDSNRRYQLTFEAEELILTKPLEIAKQ